MFAGTLPLGPLPVHRARQRARRGMTKSAGQPSVHAPHPGLCPHPDRLSLRTHDQRIDSPCEWGPQKADSCPAEPSTGSAWNPSTRGRISDIRCICCFFLLGLEKERRASCCGASGGGWSAQGLCRGGARGVTRDAGRTQDVWGVGGGARATVRWSRLIMRRYGSAQPQGYACH